jgi:hypothetical protein
MKPFIDELGAKVASGSSRRVRATAAPACEMPFRSCGAAAVLLEGGPVRVPFRACCAAALLQGLRGAGGETPGRSG